MREASVYVSFDYGDKPSGCLMLPRHVDGHTVIRLSDYTPTHQDCSPARPDSSNGWRCK